MLQLKDIHKRYVTGDLIQNALNGISLNLRENEFVAILGPSGSGKTTLLNIIGGLDRYDSGDLIINNISTKNYSDRDWDSYRNHTIGFVFQSYNLIPHQNILSNVELSLTISGISQSERKQRAKEALDKVGLGDQIHKRPNQLSGGQMQRVAIARALVNNPDILLADEPTGALDSKTSIQIMELLKEVAKEKLVVMVTHNPELANEYANRIVRLQDGNIIDDTNPYIIDEEVETKHQNMGKSSMSFLTSLLLSFNNLRTKKGRTFLTAFAGSIGIIGIALILSLSNGVETYIHNLEEDTLSEYPLTIFNSGFDISSMMNNRPSTPESNETNSYEVEEIQTLSSLLSTTRTNDLKSLKTFLDNNEDIQNSAKAIEYTYQISPQIFKVYEDNAYRQVHPDQTVSNVTGASTMPSMMSSSFNNFSALPENESLYINQYDLLVGHWPNNYHECVLVLTQRGRVSDLVLYASGLKDYKELDEILDHYAKEENVSVVSERGNYKYSDFIDVEFKLVDISSLYEYDKEYDVYVDKKDNKEYMHNVLDNAETIKIVGVVKANEDDSAAMLNSGIYYHSDLEKHVMEVAKESIMVKKQLANKEVDVFTGKFFDDNSDNDFSLDNIISVDTNAMNNAFSFNTNNLKIDPNAFNFDMSTLNVDPNSLNIDMSNLDLNTLLKDINIEISNEELNNMMNEIIEGYTKEAIKNNETDYTKMNSSFNQYLNSGRALPIIREYMGNDNNNLNDLISGLLRGLVKYIIDNNITDLSDINTITNDYLNTSEAQEIINNYLSTSTELTDEELNELVTKLYEDYVVYASENNLVNPNKMMELFNTYISSDEARNIISKDIVKVINTDSIQKQLEKNFASYSSDMNNNISNVINSLMEEIVKQISNNMSNAMSSITDNMKDAFSFNSKAFENAIKINMKADELQELMMSMMSNNRASYDGNLRKLNYAKEDSPYSIYIYPKDFESKETITKTLDKYNSDMEKEDKDKVISYTDYVATLMSSVTNIIDTISYVLVAFVAISLVVSSIMIGIITYISVLERTKEIGILRAIGASKRNISQVFNAETFIIGLLAGIIGIVTTLLILIPVNALIHALTGNNDVSAVLPTSGAIALIIISVILTLIGGLIPARAAAKKDPVTALRTE